MYNDGHLFVIYTIRHQAEKKIVVIAYISIIQNERL